MAETLARLGIRRLILWDEDVVASHNIGNQAFRQRDIGRPKTEVLLTMLHEINPELKILTKGICSTSDKLTGIIFCCIDNIDDRRALTEKWIKNPDIDFMTDVRMRMIDGVIYAADWNSNKEKDNILVSMQYTHEEAMKETPVSACGSTISVVYAPIVLANLAVANLINFINTTKYNRMITVDTSLPFIDSYLAN